MVNQDVRDVKALVGQASYVHADRAGDDVGAALWCYPDLGMRLGGFGSPLTGCTALLAVLERTLPFSLQGGTCNIDIRIVVRQMYPHRAARL
jgi:hypothetical protein